MARKIVVIGAGPGGYAAAVHAAGLGAEVTIIERDKVGGTCLNRGCIPSKVMITTAGMLDGFHRAAEFGIAVEGRIRPDLRQLTARREKVIGDQAKGLHDLFDRHGITYMSGMGILSRPGVAAVRAADGATREVRWDRLILAPGTQPFEFPAFPFDGERILSSDDALRLTEVPQSVLIVGGGVIGCEFAFILASLGSRVTVLEALDRVLPLPSVDEDCSRVLQREMKKRKIGFLPKRTVENVEYADGKLHVATGPSPLARELTQKDKERLFIDVEKMLICVGRKPDTEGLGLENLAVPLDDRGWIVAGDRMETAVSGVFAVGDALGPSKIMLAHVASAEGMVAAENAMSGNRTMAYDAVPGAIFTAPEVACVGLTEAQARERGFAVRAESVLFRTVGKAQVLGEIAGEAKIVSEEANGRIIGVHIIGPHATELIAEGTLAVRMRLTVRDLAETIHAHPTLAEIIPEVAFRSLPKAPES